jgi:hypothetical protein
MGDVVSPSTGTLSAPSGHDLRVAPPDPWASLAASEADIADRAPAEADGTSAHRASMAAEANETAVENAARRMEPAQEASRGGAFTIPLLCAGVAIIATCLLIPQADANRRLVYERAKLQADLEAVEKQVEVNDEFLRKVSEDPNLAERLAQRQMNIIRKGTQVLSLKNDAAAEMSPFQLTAVPAPVDLAPYQPRGGLLARLCHNPKSRLYLMGIGLMAMAAGLVLGFGRE